MRGNKIIPPKNECAWLTEFDCDGVPQYLITSKINNRDVYFLYKVLDGRKLEKISKGKNPKELLAKVKGVK